MMEQTTKSKVKSNAHKTLGWAGIGLCGLCCTLPIIGTLIGISSLTAVAYYLEELGILFLGLAGVLFLYSFYREKQPTRSRVTSCGSDCGCNPNKG